MTTNPFTLPELAEGERYIGGIISADGTTTYIILLPGDFNGSWKKSMNWAEKQGGDLPNRVEQALLYATAAEEFTRTAYWSNTASESGWAWSQGFDSGCQYDVLKGFELRARAVRRLVI